MLRLIVVLLCLAPSFSALAAPAFFSENLEYDFGSILQGQVVEYSFRFQNSGDDVLEIGAVRTSCGCTAALLSAKRLSPGEVGELNLKFNSQGFRGKVHKTIEIDTNDPQRPTVVFNLKGTVDLEVFADPQRISWGLVEEAQPLKARIVLYNRSQQLVTLQPLNIIGKGITATPSKLEVPAGDQIQIDVEANFLEGSRRISGYVIIPTDFSMVPQIRVPVSARLSKK